MTDFSQSPTDQQLMDLALRLGRRGAGTTAENPSVGCVIVREVGKITKVVGRGRTQSGGRPHAERVALKQAGELSTGATAYVTLEPCSHYGKSSPCAEALIEAGVSRVVCACADPDPRVAGRGFEMLRAAGIKVETGLFEQRAKRDLSGFLSRTVRKRPWLQAKMAFSPNGTIGQRDKGNFPITGLEAKSRTFALRSMADAILVGSDTVIIDDPTLSVRLPGLEDKSPLPIILDGRGRVPLEAKLIQNARQRPVWIVTGPNMADEKALALDNMGCRVIRVTDAADGHVDLMAMLTELAENGINTVFAECGAALSEALLSEGLIDQFFLYRGTSPVLENGLVALQANPEAELLQRGFALTDTHRMGNDRLYDYVRIESLNELNGG
nr:bifunctional diaminohydroxyphosphoribosylaminopyrimidine deaminase/5-amino-6-(5-phosphoribosylamino)uracil reductase RibD [uncultured Cohaesibacter sp.]